MKWLLVIVVLVLIVLIGLAIYGHNMSDEDKAKLEADAQAKRAAKDAKAAAELAARTLSGPGWRLTTTGGMPSMSGPIASLAGTATNTGSSDAMISVQVHAVDGNGVRYGSLIGNSSILPPGRQEMVAIQGVLPMAGKHIKSIEYEVRRIG